MGDVNVQEMNENDYKKRQLKCVCARWVKECLISLKPLMPIIKNDFGILAGIQNEASCKESYFNDEPKCLDLMISFK